MKAELRDVVPALFRLLEAHEVKLTPDRARELSWVRERLETACRHFHVDAPAVEVLCRTYVEVLDQ
jgi:hypothetical protein